ncbi:hypothetical protein [Spongiactinospora gelatinilytica]|uniref:hypothetical protein n=1 Tax=Spongiactinospora gelatinilytica TaxID=2666298 RepID=UPI0011B93B4A|nr:hypothetical protein [Spongiactinospora gelatinilytica]
MGTNAAGQRQKLVEVLEKALATEEHARARTLDEEASWGPAVEAGNASADAERALAEFDREHPELVAELEAERQQREQEALDRAWTS